jgi:ABC-type cobalamin transport system permease subunit
MAVRGVSQVIRLDDAVAVVAANTWAAKQGLAAASPVWDAGLNAGLSSADIVDTLARTMATTETPLGILTAFLGAPVFLWLLASGRRGW